MESPCGLAAEVVMRNLLIGLLVLCGGRSWTADPQPVWKLPKEDGEKWVKRLRDAVGRDNWTITMKGNEIAVQRDKPTAFVSMPPNSAPESKPIPAGEKTVRYVLRFAPKMTVEEYERLAAVNAASEKEYDRLNRAVRLPHKFDDFIAKTPEEEARVKAFREAVAKLPRHDLPDLYAPDNSIFFCQTGDGWSWVEDKDVSAECRDVEQTLLRYFGMYSPAAAANRSGFGRYLPERPQ
jgi:hypothetical protein